MPLKISNLETNRFGVVCAHLPNAEVDLATVNQDAQKQGVQMISTRVAADDLPLVHRLEADGYHLMDTLVYYRRALAQLPPAPANLPVRFATPDDARAVEDIARHAFANYLGHFHADPNLNNDDADAAYVEWARVSAETCGPERPMRVALQDGHVAGFLTYRQNTSEEAEIVLNAVHPKTQGQGFYGALLHSALQDCQSLVSKRVIVSTQLNNYRAQRAWARLGFYHSQSFYTFHKWMR